MVIQNTIIDLLIGTLITAAVYLTLGNVREYNDKKDKKKTVEAEATVDKKPTVSDYEDGHYEGDMD